MPSDKSGEERQSKFDRREVIRELSKLLSAWGNNQIYTEARETVYKARSLLEYPPASSVPSAGGTSDARDAARYRHLRANWSDFTGYDSKNPGEWLDKTIDSVLDVGQSPAASAPSARGTSS